MQAFTPESLLSGKDEEARVRIAQRVGHCLEADALSKSDRRAAELLARALAEDVIERVRYELSKAISHAAHLPRDLALRLAHDVDAVCCPFLEVTEVFSDSDWQQLLLTVTHGARVAVARRSQMSEGIATMLAELSDSVIAETMIKNPATPMTESVCDILIDRFSSEPWVLNRLALREDLIKQIAIRLTIHVSGVIRAKLVKNYDLPGYTEPLIDEAETNALLQISKKAHGKDLIEVAKTLKKENKLTPSLIRIALQEDEIAFLEAALSVQSGRSLEHVRSVINRAGPDAVIQLLRKADIPEKMHNDFQDAFELIRRRESHNRGSLALGAPTIKQPRAKYREI